MSKVLGWIVSTFMLFSVGYMMLPPSLEMLVDWFGPLGGLGFRTALVSLYLNFGNPFDDFFLLSLWVLAAFVGGLIARGGRRGVGVVVSTYTTILFFLGLSSLSVFQKIGGLTAFEAGLPSIPAAPPTFSTYAFLNAPVIGPLIRMSASYVIPGQQVNPQMLMLGLGEVLGLNALRILAPSCVAGFIGGMIGRSLWLRAVRPRRVNPTLTPKFLNLENMSRTLVLVLVVSTVLTLPFPTSANRLEDACTLTSEYMVEGMGGLILPDGSVGFASGFVDSGMDVVLDPSDPVLKESLLIMLGTQHFQPDCFPSIPTVDSTPQTGQVSNFYRVIPSTFLLILQKAADRHVAEMVATNVASRFSNAFATPFTNVTWIEREVAGERYYAAIFIAGESYFNMEGKLMERLAAVSDGFGSYVFEVYRNGTFTPGSTSWSSNGTIVTLGVVNIPELMELYQAAQLNSLPVPYDVVEKFTSQFSKMEQPTPFLLQLSYWKEFYHSSPQQHVFSLTGFLRNPKPVEASQDSDLSVVFVMTPSQSLTAKGLEVLAPGTALKVLSRGESMPEVSVNFNYTFPADLVVTKSVDRTVVDEDSMLRVNVEILNNDVEPVYDVTLDDSSTQQPYGSGVKLAGGSCFGRWNRVDGGGRVNHSYTLIVENLGYYSFPPAQVNYTSHGNVYQTSSNTVHVRVNTPGVLDVWRRGILFGWSSGAGLVDVVAPGYGGITSAAVIAVILALMGYSIYSSFRRRRLR